MLFLNPSKYTKMPLLILFIFGFFVSGFSQSNNQLVIGANQLNEYLPLLKGKRIAVVANQTSTIDNTHLIDTLLSREVQLVKVKLLDLK